MGNIFNYFLKGIIPIIIGAVVLYGIIAKVKVYECFVEGAKEGINVCVIFIKPLSGSGAIGVFTDIVKNYGPDSFLGFLSSIIMGGTETIFYTITVYFGAIGIKKVRHSLWVALIVDFCAVLLAVNLAVMLMR
ncbi:spore maturation protein [Clostridium sp.]|uniref:spore maturation protein n=1 Tax=Clostridium sp. TaxID=1506 RepID=UPI0032179979